MMRISSLVSPLDGPKTSLPSDPNFHSNSLTQEGRLMSSCRYFCMPDLQQGPDEGLDEGLDENLGTGGVYNPAKVWFDPHARYTECGCCVSGRCSQVNCAVTHTSPLPKKAHSFRAPGVHSYALPGPRMQCGVCTSRVPESLSVVLNSALCVNECENAQLCCRHVPRNRVMCMVLVPQENDVCCYDKVNHLTRTQANARMYPGCSHSDRLRRPTPCPCHFTRNYCHSEPYSSTMEEDVQLFSPYTRKIPAVGCVSEYASGLTIRELRLRSECGENLTGNIHTGIQKTKDRKNCDACPYTACSKEFKLLAKGSGTYESTRRESMMRNKLEKGDASGHELNTCCSSGCTRSQCTNSECLAIRDQTECICDSRISASGALDSCNASVTLKQPEPANSMNSDTGNEEQVYSKPSGSHPHSKSPQPAKGPPRKDAYALLPKHSRFCTSRDARWDTKTMDACVSQNTNSSNSTLSFSSSGPDELNNQKQQKLDEERYSKTSPNLKDLTQNLSRVEKSPNKLEREVLPVEDNPSWHVYYFGSANMREKRKSFWYQLTFLIRKENSSGKSNNTDSRPRRYGCTFSGCNNEFSTSGHLARHMRLHTGSKPYKCPIENCQSIFSRHDNMTTHYKSHMKRLKTIKGISPSLQESQSSFANPQTRTKSLETDSNCYSKSSPPLSQIHS